MSNEITPTDSVCPVYLEPRNPAQIKADQAEAEARLLEQEARQVAKDAVLAKLGLSADELAALLGA